MLVVKVIVVKVIVVKVVVKAVVKAERERVQDSICLNTSHLRTIVKHGRRKGNVGNVESNGNVQRRVLLLAASSSAFYFLLLLLTALHHHLVWAHLSFHVI